MSRSESNILHDVYPQITRREWRRIAVLSSIVVVIVSLPYLIGALSSTPQQIFGGPLTMLEDQYSYVAKMVQGAHGAWLFHLPYTATPQPGIFLYEFYLLLGKLSGLFGLTQMGMFHVARVLFGLLALLVMYRFIAEFVASAAVRFIAFLLAVLAGGPGWFAFISGQPTLLSSLPLELILPEGFTFLMLYTLPHLLLARALLLLGAIGVWRAGRSGSLKLTIGAGLLWAIMATLQPVYAAVVLALAFLMFASRSIVARRPDWRQARAGIIAGLMSLPMVLYVIIALSGDPVFGPWLQTAITSPGPLLYLLSYGIPIILAIGGLIYTLPRRDAGLLFLALWTLATPLLVYAPTNAQRRLIESWQIPLSVMAAIGLVRYVLLPLRRRYAPHKFERSILALLIVVLMPTYIMLLTYNVVSSLTHWPPLFQSAGFVAATDWLERNASYADGVLAAYDTSTVIPARAAVRVTLGHRAETLFVDERKIDVQRFFDSAVSGDWKRDLLKRLNLNYVWYGPEERSLGSFDPASAPYLKQVFAQGDVRLYRVEP